MLSNDDYNDNSDDEWFYSSFKRYDDLLMYDVHGSISCASFVNSSRLLLAATGGQHEVWELGIPKKLIAGRDAGRTRDRDFNVITAGYTVGSPKRILPVDCGFVASESNGVNYYSIPNSSHDTDIISHKTTVRNNTKDSPVAVTGSCVFSGTNLLDIVKFNLTTGNSEAILLNSSDKSTETGSSVLSEIQYKCGNFYSCLLDKGDVFIQDIRENSLTQGSSISGFSGGTWTMDVSESGTHISTFSSNGDLHVYDNRILVKPLFSKTIEDKEKFGYRSSNHCCVRLSPNDTFVSVSGLNRNIQILNLKSNLESNLEDCWFNHDGHRSKEVSHIVTHLWHPFQDNVVFSADNTGQLQAWRFKES